MSIRDMNNSVALPAVEAKLPMGDRSWISEGW